MELLSLLSVYELLSLTVTGMLIVSGLLVCFIWRRAYAAGEISGYERRSNEQYKAVQKEVSRHKESDDYRNNLENSYLKGKIDGAREELERFTICYEPFVDIHESFFWKRIEAGYQMQIFYNGIPVGDSTRRVVRQNEKFKDENVRQILDQVNSIIDSVSQMANSKGITVRTTKTPLQTGTKR